MISSRGKRRRTPQRSLRQRPCLSMTENAGRKRERLDCESGWGARALGLPRRPLALDADAESNAVLASALAGSRRTTPELPIKLSNSDSAPEVESSAQENLARAVPDRPNLQHEYQCRRWPISNISAARTAEFQSIARLARLGPIGNARSSASMSAASRLSSAARALSWT